MIKVFIEGLVLSGIHGVTAKERDRRQPFQVDITATVAFESADDVLATADYRRMKEVAERVVLTESHQLVETIAERIARGVLEDVHVSEVTVTVRKMTIWNNGIPGVSFTLARSSCSG
ncbi:MAG: dihydroneopterin aldolase [Candidatus Pacebacteria bacterium]|nr:dihydroneopterin aldolase [Candidatus Paceibacterota bacterium]